MRRVTSSNSIYFGLTPDNSCVINQLYILITEAHNITLTLDYNTCRTEPRAALTHQTPNQNCYEEQHMGALSLCGNQYRERWGPARVSGRRRLKVESVYQLISGNKKSNIEKRIQRNLKDVCQSRQAEEFDNNGTQRED